MCVRANLHNYTMWYHLILSAVNGLLHLLLLLLVWVEVLWLATVRLTTATDTEKGRCEALTPVT